VASQRPKQPESTIDHPSPQCPDLPRDRFEAAWRAALEGGVVPQIKHYLEEVQEPVRALLLDELEAVERQYRPRLPAGNAVPGEPTLPAAPPAEAPAEHCATFEYHAPNEGSATVERKANGASSADTEVTAFSLSEDAESTGSPGITVANYEILSELGRGAMGVVYKARQRGLNRVVALKMVLSGPHADAAQLARFRSEAEAAAQLQHPSIVQVYEVGEFNGQAYFSLEFVDGQSLADKIAGEPQPPRHAAELVQLLALAMSYAHHQGIIHRDLKPANVLLSSEGVPKIADFGLAKRLEGDSSQTRSGTIMGTPSYMSPEQAWGKNKEIGPLADEYGLGAILYAMLTGRPPFVGTTVLDTLEQVRAREPIPPSQLQPKIPRDLETICLKCLQKEPHKRYASTEDLADDLQRFLAGEPIKARPVSVWERCWRWCRRNPRVASLTAAVLGLLVLVTIGSVAAAVQINFEKRLAEQARDLADQNAEQARRAQQRADENARVAQDQANLTVKTFYQVVVELQNQLRDRPDMQKLRAKLLEDALAGLNEVAKSAENSNLLRRTLGGAYQRMGDLALEMGQTDEAGRQYDRALSIFEQLADLDPQDDVSKWNLAVTYEKEGTINHRLRGDISKTREFYRKASQLREALAAGPRREPKLTQTLVDNALAGSYAAEANLALLMGNPVAARDYLQRALQLREQLAAADSQNRQAQEALATLYITLGQVGFHLRDAEAARGYYLKCLQLREALAKADPDSVPFQKGLADAHQKTGDMLLHLRGKESLGTVREHYTTAHELQRKLYQRNPANTEMRQALASSCYRLGTVAQRFGEAAESQKQFRACLQLRESLAKEDPTNLYKQVELVLAQARCGEHDKAAAAAGRLRADAAKDAGILYYLGCAYALCAASADEPPLRAQYAGEALDTLRQAVACGYKDLVSLETDPDLESLQGRPDYKELIQSLNKH
jgi:serine/threonine-protein kinase